MVNKRSSVSDIKPLIPIEAIILLSNDGHKLPQKILIEPNIGLAGDVRRPVIEILNRIIANEAILTQKTRGAHWNVSGSSFFELHILFDTQYKQLNEMADKIAERTRMMGGTAIASFGEFLTHARIVEEINQIPDILHLLADHESVIRYLREDIRKCDEEYEDEGTVELLVGLMSLHEKLAWMLRSYVEKEPVHSESQKRISRDE